MLSRLLPTRVGLVELNSEMSSVRFLIILVCISTTVDSAAVPNQDCGELFQSKLSELLAIKQSCNSTFYRSCCQVV